MSNPVLPSPSLVAWLFLGLGLAGGMMAQDTPANAAKPLPISLTPPAPASPRINGPGIFGVRPGSPFLYAIPATGERPMKFSAAGLPPGLQLDEATGQITGVVSEPGETRVTLRAKNRLGAVERVWRIRVGDTLALTPPMGWNSWNCWAAAVDQEKVLRSARAMVSSGLAQHGWTYINIDDTWQGKRGGPWNAIQSDPVKFPDMKALCEEIHRLGLKAGIYSTPWVTSYGQHVGGSSDQPDGSWSPPSAADTANEANLYNKDILPWSNGKYSFAQADARQWAAWGIDYLKYDWYPIRAREVRTMADALRASGRDVVYSLSNAAPINGAAEWVPLANSWRTTGDIRDEWRSMAANGFSQDPWAHFAGPGHWNDPDMLVVGYVGWGPRLHPSRLSPDEQYSHISLWCLLSSPLLIGCDLERLDAFTLGLLTNDEVLAVDQDPVGRQAEQIGHSENETVYLKPLQDGSWAVGLFNRRPSPAVMTVKWSDVGLLGAATVRDLWRQKDLGRFQEDFSATVPAHGVMLIRVSASR